MISVIKGSVLLTFTETTDTDLLDIVGGQIEKSEEQEVHEYTQRSQISD